MTSYMVGTHSTGEKRAKRMPDPTVETTIHLQNSGTILKKLLYHGSKYSNKSTLASSLVSAYSFGKPSLRLTQDWIET